mmetsp:Transcript_4596/g.6804  ORF Transcript_4596/g.6804 Transcript_4596/m.6804 type:complete len:131 (-) Transcript_4596:68-460(-)
MPKVHAAFHHSSNDFDFDSCGCQIKRKRYCRAGTFLSCALDAIDNIPTYGLDFLQNEEVIIKLKRRIVDRKSQLIVFKAIEQPETNELEDAMLSYMHTKADCALNCCATPCLWLATFCHVYPPMIYEVLD